MPPGTHWNIRKTSRREAQIAEIARRIGTDEDKFAAVIDFALGYTLYGIINTQQTKTEGYNKNK